MLFAGVALVSTGGIQRALQSQVVKIFLAFVAWMALTTLTSSWRGGSFGVLKFYLMVAVPMIFITAGLLSNWKAVRVSITTMGVSAIVIIGTTFAFGTMDDDRRLALTSSGTLGNENDLASHMVLLLPLQVYLLLDRAGAWYVRLLMLVSTPLTVILILRTASRGAMVALVLLFAVAVWKASGGVRAFLIAAALFGVLLAPFVVPRSLLDRMMMKSTGEYTEAEASADIRWDSFVSGLRYTIQNPIVGIGPGQFAVYNSKAKEGSGRNVWVASHCSWIDLSSEMGIPALALMLLILAYAGAGVNQVYQLALRDGQHDIANLCLAFLTASVGYLGTITFLSNVYRFYLPALIGLAVAIHVVGMAELARRRGRAPQPDVLPVGARR